MRRLYARALLWLIRPALDEHSSRVNVRMNVRVMAGLRDSQAAVLDSVRRNESQAG